MNERVRLDKAHKQAHDYFLKEFGRGHFHRKTYASYIAHMDSVLTVMFETIHQLRELMKMPKKAKTLSTWKGFINIELSTPQKESAKVWADKPAILDEQIFQALSAGYKLSVTYSGDQDTVTASLSCLNEKSDNYQYTLTARARTPFLAIQVLLYKHFIVSKEEWHSVGRVPDSDDIG